MNRRRVFPLVIALSARVQSYPSGASDQEMND
jgi:hypothetical protein